MRLHVNLGVEASWVGLTSQDSVTSMDTSPVTQEEAGKTMDLSLSTDDISREHAPFLQQPPSPTGSQYSQERAPVLDTEPPEASESKNRGIMSSPPRPAPIAAASSTTFTDAAVASVEVHPSQASAAIEIIAQSEAGVELGFVAKSRQGIEVTTSSSAPTAFYEVKLSPSAKIQTVAKESQSERRAQKMRRFFSPGEQVTVEEIPDQNESMAWSSQPRDAPGSARSVISGIFELEISSPETLKRERTAERRASSDDVDLQDCPQPRIDIPSEPRLDVFDDTTGGQAWRHDEESNDEPNISSVSQRSPRGGLQKVVDNLEVTSPRSIGGKASSSPLKRSGQTRILRKPRSLQDIKNYHVGTEDTALASGASRSAVSGLSHPWTPLPSSPPPFEPSRSPSPSSRGLGDRPRTHVRSLLADSLERYSLAKSKAHDAGNVDPSTGSLAQGIGEDRTGSTPAGSGDTARIRGASEIRAGGRFGTGWRWGRREPGKREARGRFLPKSKLRLGYIEGRSVGMAELFEDGSKSFERFVEEQQGEDGPDHIVRSQGCSSLLIPRCQRVTQTFVVGRGCCLYWEFEVQGNEIDFALRLRSQGMGGSTEEDIFRMRRYPSGKRYQGKWNANKDHAAIVVMVWDNSFGLIFPKTVVCKTRLLEPQVEANAPPPGPPPASIGNLARALPDQSSRRGGASGAAGGWRKGGGGGGNSQAAYTETLAIEVVEGEDPATSEVRVDESGVEESKGSRLRVRDGRGTGVPDMIQPEDYLGWTWSPEA